MKTSDYVTLLIVCSATTLFCALAAWWLYRASERSRVTVRRDPADFPDWQPALMVKVEGWPSSALFVLAVVTTCIGVSASVLVVGLLLVLAKIVRIWLTGRVPEWLLPALVLGLIAILGGALLLRVFRDLRI